MAIRDWLGKFRKSVQPVDYSPDNAWERAQKLKELRLSKKIENMTRDNTNKQLEQQYREMRDARTKNLSKEMGNGLLAPTSITRERYIKIEGESRNDSRSPIREIVERNPEHNKIMRKELEESNKYEKAKQMAQKLSQRRQARTIKQKYKAAQSRRAIVKGFIKGIGRAEQAAKRMFLPRFPSRFPSQKREQGVYSPEHQKYIYPQQEINAPKQYPSDNKVYRYPGRNTLPPGSSLIQGTPIQQQEVPPIRGVERYHPLPPTYRWERSLLTGEWVMKKIL